MLKNIIRYIRSSKYREFVKMCRLVKKADNFIFTVDFLMKNNRISRGRRRKFWKEFVRDDRNRSQVMSYFEDIFVTGEKK